MNKRCNLETFRINLGLTQEQMAEKLQCTRVYYNMIENGKSFGTIEFWENFKRVFGIENYDMWDLIERGA